MGIGKHYDGNTQIFPVIQNWTIVYPVPKQGTR